MEKITAQLAENYTNPVVSDLTETDLDTVQGTAYVIQYTVTTDEGTFYQTNIDLYLDNYLFEVSITDYDETVTPDLYKVANYLVNSVLVLE